MTEGIHHILTGEKIENVEDLPVDDDTAAAEWLSQFTEDTPTT